MTFEEEAAGIKREQFADLQKREVIFLVKADYGYEVRQWLGSGGVSPTSAYDTPGEAGARALQLLGLAEPVTPQNWPEIAGIGDAGPPPRPQPKIV